MCAQELSNSCNILFRVLQHVSGSIMGGRHFHAAELIYTEILLILSQSFLREKYGAGIINLNGSCDSQ